MTGKVDIETGHNQNPIQNQSQNQNQNQNGNQLYPNMMESPQLRWAFIRKVYAIMTLQLLLTVGVATTVVMVKPIARFVKYETLGIVVYVCVLVLAVLTTFALSYFRKRHPWNYLLLMLFTIWLAFSVGLICAFTKGEIVMEAAILTSIMAIGLTLYTFWAIRRGQDFTFLGPFLFSAVLILIPFGIIQILFPLGKLSHMIYGCLGALIFSAYIVYDTNNLIKRHSYDDYIWAAAQLYLDIINLFLSLITAFRAGH